MLEVERASSEDIEDLANIYLEGYAGLEEYAYTNREDVLAYLNWLFRRDGAGVFVAKVEGRKVGFVAVDGNWFSKREGRVVGAIHELVVLPNYRNRSIGKRLLESAIEYFKEKNLPLAELWVGDENSRAIEFYKKHGFEERDRFNYWIRMTRWLRNEGGG